MSKTDALPPLLPDEVEFYGFSNSTKDMMIPLKPRLCIKFAEYYRGAIGTAKYKLELFGKKKCKIHLKRRTVDLESDEAIAVRSKIQFALVNFRNNDLYYVNGYLGRGEDLPADTGDPRLLGEDYVIHTPCFIVGVHKDFISQCTDMYSEIYGKLCGTQTSAEMESEATSRSASLSRPKEATRKCEIPVRFRVIRLPDKNFKAVNIERDIHRKTESSHLVRDILKRFEQKYDPVTGLNEIEELNVYYSTLIEISRIAAWKVHSVETFHIKDGRNDIYESVLSVEYTPRVEIDSKDRKFCNVCVDELDKFNPAAYMDRTDDQLLLDFENQWYVITEGGCRLTLGRGRSSFLERGPGLAAKNILPKMVAQSDIKLINEILERKLQILREKQERGWLAEWDSCHPHLCAPASIPIEDEISCASSKFSTDKPESRKHYPKPFVFGVCPDEKLDTP